MYLKNITSMTINTIILVYLLDYPQAPLFFAVGHPIERPSGGCSSISSTQGQGLLHWEDCLHQA